MPRGRRKTTGNAMLKSAEMIGWALGGLEREITLTKERLSALSAQAAKLRERIGRGRSASPVAAPSTGAAPAGRKRRRRRMSKEARKRISEMMKKRWAERRKAKG